MTSSAGRIDRRRMIGSTILAGMAPLLASVGSRVLASPEPAVTLLDMCRHMLLREYYGGPPRQRVAADGLAGFNHSGEHAPLIEEQRNGAEWVLHGVLAGKPDYVALGWKALDLGRTWQEPDGGFGRLGYYHSNSLYLEGLARALVINPSAATAERLDGLRRGLAWMMRPATEEVGLQQNGPYAHRDYILAAMFGQGAMLLEDAELAHKARHIAEAGLARQRADGVNPELDGFDASYQMVGVLFALRYYPCAPADLVPVLRRMIGRAITAGLRAQQPDGSFSTEGSTRVGRELHGGAVKQPNYPEIFEALCYADRVMPTPAWREAAVAAARFNRIPIPSQPPR